MEILLTYKRCHDWLCMIPVQLQFYVLFFFNAKFCSGDYISLWIFQVPLLLTCKVNLSLQVSITTVFEMQGCRLVHSTYFLHVPVFISCMFLCWDVQWTNLVTSRAGLQMSGPRAQTYVCETSGTLNLLCSYRPPLLPLWDSVLSDVKLHLTK